MAAASPTPHALHGVAYDGGQQPLASERDEAHPANNSTQRWWQEVAS
jgi:hypothetical protein